MKKKILVAPYWNLNNSRIFKIVNLNPILVAPYWNLNEEIPTSEKENLDHISSSILEFK